MSMIALLILILCLIVYSGYDPKLDWVIFKDNDRHLLLWYNSNWLGKKTERKYVILY